MPSTRHKIIIGIDYGTTYSGVSYVTTDKSDIKDINIVATWPGEQHTAWKTPTRIAYKRENSQIQSNKWGFDVSSKLVSYSWTKLLLDKNAAVGDHGDDALSNMVDPGMLQVPSFRDAAGVCEDFLREVFTYVSRKLRQQMTDLTFESTPMECWITLPAIWSDEAKDATLEAAKRAGFGNRTEDEVFTIAEPEAAAIAVLRESSERDAINAIEPGNNILICDCGGGTVDITTYTITKVAPCLDFDELCIGIGGKCGSTFIDRNLHDLLSKRFGLSFDNLESTQKGPGSKFMMDFEKCKREFGLKDEQDILEVSGLKLGIPDSEYYDEEERLVKLTYEDMKGLFDPVIRKITSLVDQQMKDAKQKKNALIDRIILVGGFSESPYLYGALGDWCWRNGNIKLLYPDHPQSAIVRGAALRGLEGIAPRIKHARRHYGFALNLPFREGIDPEESAFLEAMSDEKLCRKRMWWLISKGDEVTQGAFRTAFCEVEYEPGEETISSIALYSCSLMDAPEYSTHKRVDKVGVIESTFQASFKFGRTRSRYNPRLRRTVHKFSCEIQVVFGDKGSNLTFRNVVNGDIISTVAIKFDQR